MLPPAEDRISAAVFNNAAWCDSVCRALGCDTDFVDGLWINRSPSPPFYSNAITLTRGGSQEQMRRLELLAGARPSAGWSVKDAFSALDLGSLGFRVLFEADWLHLPAGHAPVGSEARGLRWDRVTSEPELAAWETAWRRAPGNELDDASAPPRIFMPALLDDPDIVLLVARAREGIVGVVVGNRSDDGSGPVAGVSNIAQPVDDGVASRAGAIAAVGAAFPDLPLVGYERGADLVAMQAFGFESLGSLRVWVID